MHDLLLFSPASEIVNVLLAFYKSNYNPLRLEFCFNYLHSKICKSLAISIANAINESLGNHFQYDQTPLRQVPTHSWEIDKYRRMNQKPS